MSLIKTGDLLARYRHNLEAQQRAFIAAVEALQQIADDVDCHATARRRAELGLAAAKGDLSKIY